MPNQPEPLSTRHAVRLYFLGLGCVMLGAGLTDHLDSLVPMALGASAGLMLGMPLVLHLGRRFLRPSV